VIRLLVIVALAACGGDDGEPPPFPEDYASTFAEVRNCRNSIDHDLMRIRVLAAPDTKDAYLAKTAFPDGALLLKEEYSNSDPTCSGPIERFTVMQKLPVGSSPATLDWTWYELDGKRKLETVDAQRCISCHTSCGKPPEGFDGTCTMP
jgi:hypothetical protein